MIKKRDAQGLSIQVIILIAIGLIVLVILIAIFSNETGKTVGTLGSCLSRGGTCQSECGDGREVPEIECKEPLEVCCITI